MIRASGCLNTKVSGTETSRDSRRVSLDQAGQIIRCDEDES